MLLIDLLANDLMYVIALCGWSVVLVGALFCLLLLRRKHRNKRGLLMAVHAGLAAWMFLVVGTLAEASFALFVDRSDTFNVTHVSKRWFRRHHDAEKQPPLGNRDPSPYTRFIAPGKKRICFVGDSFTAGHGVNNMADRFTDRIRARLEDVQPGKYVVANLGDPGLEASMIEAVVHKLLLDGDDMSMVVYVYCLNDIEGYDTRTQESIQKIYAAGPSFFLFRDTYLFNWLYYRYLQVSNTGVKSYFTTLADAYQSEHWEGLRRKLSQLHRECGEGNVELRMAIFPFLHCLGDDYPFLEAHQKLVDFCDAEGIRVLDLEPIFRSHAEENLTVNAFDAHPNERAHAIAAEAMEKELMPDLFEAQ